MKSPSARRAESIRSSKMSESSVRKKTASGKTNAGKSSAGSARRSSTSAAAKKRAAAKKSAVQDNPLGSMWSREADPYDDPFAAAPRPAPRRQSATVSSASSGKSARKGASSGKNAAGKRSPAVQDNPLGSMHAHSTDPYDDPRMSSPTTRSRIASRDDFDAPARPNRKRSATSAKKADLFDDFDAPARAARTGLSRPASAKRSIARASETHAPTSSRSSAPKRGAHGNGASGGRSPGGRRGGGKRGGYLTFVLSSLIAICLLAAGFQLYSYANFRKMRTAVTSESFFAGTSIDGIDVSSMTMESALTYWEEQVEPSYAGRAVTLSDGRTVAATELGYASDYREVISAAWQSQTTGRLKDRYSALRRYSASGTGYRVTRTLYTDEAVSAYTSQLASEINVPVSEPSITGFDQSSLSFTFGAGVQGKTLDQTALAADLKSAMDAGGGTVTLKIDTQDPTVSVEEMQSLYGLRAYAVTNASSSSSNRLNNVTLALNAINGTLLQPGEEFSFNETVGKRTAERGYKVAAAYSGGEVTEELGGGICQVSTTLFNAVVKADLEVTERHAHSMPVSYVDMGKDATVSWGSQDFKFKNNTSEPVYIVAYLDSDKKVRVGVFGRAIANGEYITVEAEDTYTKKYQTTYQYNAFLLPGAQNVLQSGRNTYKATAYKLRWSASGELISKEVLCNSTYNGRDEIIEYGP